MQKMSQFGKRGPISHFYITVPLSQGVLQDEGIDEEVAEVTRRNKDKIVAKYATLLTDVCGRLQQNGIDMGEFSLFVVARFPPGDCIPHTNDLGEMFKAITRNGLWDFWNYSPLEEIVERFGKGDPQLFLWMNEYKSDVVGFKACTKIVAYLSKVEFDSFDDSDAEQPAPVKPAKHDYRYYRKLSLKLKLNVANRSLSFIDDLWSSVSECFLLPPLSAILSRVHKGCITVVWLIPTGLVPRLLMEIHKAGDFFQQHHIASVTLDDQCVYDEQTSTFKQRQSMVVSSHVKSYQPPYLFFNFINIQLSFSMSYIIVFLCCSHQDPQQLLQACDQGDLEAALRLLATDIDVDIKDTVRLFSSR